MQFHLNGFRPGDPRVVEAGDRHGQDEVDVLIVGCGPAGLTLASQLAAFPEISTRIVEMKPDRLLVGQADGIACRSMEMFEAFGFSERVMSEGYWVNETAFWKPDAERPEHIVRTGRIQDTEDGLSEFPHMILNQARVHDFFLDVMRDSASRLEPVYSRRFVDFEVENSGEGAFPVTATLERLDAGHEGELETVRARYVVGCDGARSSVRASMGRTLHGDSASQIWGVMDVLAVTDFPDIRLKTLIQSADSGSIVVIPREGGYMVRLYIELGELGEHERVSSREITRESVVETAHKIMHPYTLDVKETPWWSVYQIGQRLCDKFDDVPDDEIDTRTPRVFITGDACHTHSPKAGQGMNVSMRDSFNLAWKLAAVIQGRSPAELLHTYSAERRAVAKELIDFDREWAAVLSARPENETAGGTDESQADDAAEFQRYFVKSGRYTAGTGIQYGESLISAAPTHQHLAKGFDIGMRFHSAPVIRLGDAKPMHLAHTVKADGRWRLFVFAGVDDDAGPDQRSRALFDFLADASGSPVRMFTPPGDDIDSVIDVRAVFQLPHRDLNVGGLPRILLPGKGRYGLLDYEKAFCSDRAAGNDIYDLRGIDRDQGCMVVVRPDQHVAQVLPLDGHIALTDFFTRVLL